MTVRITYNLFSSVLSIFLLTTLFSISTNVVHAQSVPQPSGPPGSWNLVFDDEFDSTTSDPTSLDSTKWLTCYPWVSSDGGCTNSGNNELEWYQPYNVLVGNGILNLRAQKQRILAANGSTYNYTSGMVTTGRYGSNLTVPSKFTYQYGFIEARVKVPKGKGLWPAFWTLPDDESWPPEIDAMEVLGNDTTTVYMTIHWKNPDGTNGQDGTSFSGPDFSTDWHTFGLDWEPNYVVWYIDGIKRKSYTNTAHIPSKPMYLLLDLAVGGNWPGSPSRTTPFPSYFQIDYVRAWKPL